MEVDEGDECEPNSHIHIARWRAELMHSPNARDEAGPVGDGDEEETGEEEGDERLCAWTTDSHCESREAFNGELHRVLNLPRNLFEASCEEDQRNDHHHHHDPTHDDGAGDRRIEVKECCNVMLFAAEIDDAMWNNRLKRELNHVSWETVQPNAAKRCNGECVKEKDAECGEE